jgi:nitrite reductase (NADH) small subunit
VTATVEHRAGRLDAIPVNEGRMLRVAGHLVAVFHLRGGGVRAVQPWCPHRRGPLADGLVGAGEVVCPLHGRTFDLASGEAAGGGTGVATFPARVDEKGTIVLSLPEDGPLPCYADAIAGQMAP